jgi:hypothetical protein
MRELVFLLEEESAKALLEVLFPRLVPTDIPVHPRFIIFEGKQDLEKRLERKLRGYLNPLARFLVVRDQDRADCRRVKRHLVNLCTRAGHPGAIVRIACRELEAFYLGDLAAVELGLGFNGIASRQNRARYRNPDELHLPSRELEKLTGRRYQKIAGSRAIAPHLNLETSRSRSFFHLIKAVRDVVALLAASS